MVIMMMLTIMIFLGIALQDGALGLPRLPKQPSPSLLDTLLLLLVLLRPSLLSLGGIAQLASSDPVEVLFNPHGAVVS